MKLLQAGMYQTTPVLCEKVQSGRKVVAPALGLKGTGTNLSHPLALRNQTLGKIWVIMAKPARALLLLA